MYVCSVDEEAGLLLGVYTVGATGDADYEAAASSIAAHDRWAAERGVPCVVVVIVDPGVPAPAARWRRRFAEITRDARSHLYYFVLVTDSPLIRGVFTAVSWLLGQLRPSVHLSCERSLAAARNWLEIERGTSFSVLEELEQRARNAAGAQH